LVRITATLEAALNTTLDLHEPTVRDQVGGLLQLWDRYHSNILNLFRRSKIEAHSCNGSVEAYITNVLPRLKDDDLKPSAKRDILDKYIKTLQSHGITEEHLSQGFVNASRELPDFVSRVNATLSDGFIRDMNRKYEETFSNIKATDMEIGAYEAKIKSIQEYASSIHLVSVSSVLGSLFGTEITDPQARAKLDQLNEDLRKLASLIEEGRREIQRMRPIAQTLGHAIEAAHNVRGVLLTIPPYIDAVSLLMGRFANVWASLKHDTQQLWDILVIIKDDVDEPQVV